MPKIVAIGESLLDIIFSDQKPVSATPGGSMLNTAVSLGRLGLNVYFVSDYGRDQVGEMIDAFLASNGVNTRYVQHYDRHKSGLALAFLNESRDAVYQFYKDFPDQRMEDLAVPFEKNDILLFGSFFALTPEVKKALLRMLGSAREAGALIMYDPNFRRPHLAELGMLRPMIIENMHYADIVRGSNEDFELIFGAKTPQAAWKEVAECGCSCLVYTANQNGVDIFSQESSLHLDVPPIKTVSTIGAGDNFNAGILWTLVRGRYTAEEMRCLPEMVWKKAGMNGIAFASDVCMHYENYISEEFVLEHLKRDD